MPRRMRRRRQRRAETRQDSRAPVRGSDTSRARLSASVGPSVSVTGAIRPRFAVRPPVPSVPRVRPLRGRVNVGGAARGAARGALELPANLSSEVAQAYFDKRRERILQETETSSVPSLVRDTCKPRPSSVRSRRGSGGSRPFVPWCDRSTEGRRRS